MVTKAQQSEITTERMLTVARTAFTRDGYANAGIEDIVRAANVTRGALYHHFGSKEGLFRAVVEAVQAEIGQRVEAAAAQTEGLWDQLLAGCEAFLRASSDAEIRRILLIDAPAVIGWESWRQMDAEHSMRSLYDVLHELQMADEIVPLPLTALTHLVSGAMNEVALWIAGSDDANALEDALLALRGWLLALRR